MYKRNNNKHIPNDSVLAVSSPKRQHHACYSYSGFKGRKFFIFNLRVLTGIIVDIIVIVIDGVVIW